MRSRNIRNYKVVLGMMNFVCAGRMRWWILFNWERDHQCFKENWMKTKKNWMNKLNFIEIYLYWPFFVVVIVDLMMKHAWFGMYFIFLLLLFWEQSEYNDQWFKSIEKNDHNSWFDFELDFSLNNVRLKIKQN